MRRDGAAALLAAALVLTAVLPAHADARADAEAWAAQSEATSGPSAVELARRALALTDEFDPTAFVLAGRKGEVVDDAYLEARQAYRAHRARLYRAWGRALLEHGQPVPASRALRRAQELAPAPEAATLLARALLGRGLAWEALDTAVAATGAVAAANEAADAIGLPSLQAEYDRRRLLARPTGLATGSTPGDSHPTGPGDFDTPRPQPRSGPFALPASTRLSSGARARLDGPGLTLVYVAPRGCSTCSRDIEEIARSAPAGLAIQVAAFRPEEDQALRQGLRLYRRDWPVLYAADVATALEIPGGSALLVGREGWSGALLAAPFRASLPAAIAVLTAQDVVESRPRAAWNRRPVVRAERPLRPAPEPGGLFPGEEEPAPEAWRELVAAFDASRYREALRLLEALEAQPEAWLLRPEARANRARILAGLGRGEESRRLLLRTGDSRFQEQIDRLLEQAPRAR